MGQWLNDNRELIALFMSFAMLVVWVTYLQLLLVQFRHSKRSTILITRAGGRGMRSRCLVTNMSAQPLYVTSVIGTLHYGERQIELALTDLRDLPGDLGADPRSRMGQGSLNTGQFMDIGHFDEIIGALLEANGETDIQVEDIGQCDLTVVALHAFESLPIGARRSFRFDRNATKGPKVQPLTIVTNQIRKRSGRRALLRKVEFHS